MNSVLMIPVDLIDPHPHNPRRGYGDDWAGTRWAREPHVRVGDPCYRCGTPMVPASRRWSAWSIPPGHRKHAGLGLCGSCARKYRAGHLAEAIAS